MWLILAFLSATLLGFYDSFKKQSLRDNAVIPVLFLNTLRSSSCRQALRCSTGRYSMWHPEDGRSTNI